VVAGLPEPIEGLDGGFRFSRRALLVENVRARMLGGQAVVNGRLEISGESSGRYHADVVVRDLTWPIGTSSSATINATVAVDSPTEGERQPLVSGDLEIARLRYVDDLRLGLDVNSLLRRRPSAAATFDPDDASVRLDLRVTGSRDLRVSNNVIRTSIRFDSTSRVFTVVGTDLVPGVLGNLVIEPGGEVTFRGTRFQIQRGFLTFDRSFEIDPSLDVTATTELREWTISIVVTGRASDVDVALVSDPPLAREDIVLLLAVGMTRAETEEMGYGAALASVAPELIWGLTGFGEDIERFLPLLRSIQVSSEYNTRSGEVEPRVTASWPVTDRFRVGVSGSLQSIQSLQGSRIGAEYQINEETTLNVNYGANEDSSFGELGIDLRWFREF
jgi:autotransporter translocation and assembly factor TamB